MKTCSTLGVLVLLLSALGACGDDDGGTDAGPAADAGPGTVDAGPGDSDAGPGDSDAGGLDAGPEGVDAGPGGTDAGDFTPSAAAEYFCDSGYEPMCGYGEPGGYADRTSCLVAYDGYDLDKQLCVANAAGMGDCEAANGAGDCA